MGMTDPTSQSSGLDPSGTSSTTSSTVTDLPPWLKPYAQQFIKAYQGLVFNKDGSVKQMPASLNQQVAPFTPYQNQALGMYGQGTPFAQQLAGGAARSLQDTLSGAYLNPQTNPYLDATYQAAAKPVVENYQFATAPGNMAAAQRAGQMGGSAYNEQNILNQYGLGSNLSDLAANIYGQNYQQERARQAGAQAFAPGTTQNLYAPAQNLLGAGAYQQGQQQNVLNTNFANALRGVEFPFALLGGFGGALGQAGQGTGTSSSTSTFPNAFLTGFPSTTSSSGSLPSWLLPAVGGAAALPAIGSALSSLGGGK